MFLNDGNSGIPGGHTGFVGSHGSNILTLKSEPYYSLAVRLMGVEGRGGFRNRVDLRGWAFRNGSFAGDPMGEMGWARVRVNASGEPPRS